MRNSDSVSSYVLTCTRFRSRAFHMHLSLVTDAYTRNGFVSSSDPQDLIDEYDAEEASYCLLHLRSQPETLAGTFRLIPGYRGLPALSVVPRLPIEGIPERFCECTRVVSAVRSLGAAPGAKGNVLLETVLQSVAYAQAHGMLGVVSLGSPRVFERINAAFFGVQRALAVPCMHSGGIVIPSLIWVEEFERRMKEHAVYLYSQYAEAKAGWFRNSV